MARKTVSIDLDDFDTIWEPIPYESVRQNYLHEMSTPMPESKALVIVATVLAVAVIALTVFALVVVL